MSNTRDMLKEKQNEYIQKLSTFSFNDIKRTFELLQKCKERVHNGEKNVSFNNEPMDEGVKAILELKSRFEDDIKKIFIANGEYITHITGVSPESMNEEKILKSKNKPNNYETESGDWTFASSSPINGKNPYIARSKNGMVKIEKNAYVYGGDNIDIETTEDGKKRVVLKQPNYIYTINPQKFKPVTTLKLDENNNPYFEFSEEWISDEDVDIKNKKEVSKIEKIVDITEFIKNYQVFCDVHSQGIAMQLIRTNRSEAIRMVLDKIKSKDLRYINGEANINVNPILENVIKAIDTLTRRSISRKEEYC